LFFVVFLESSKVLHLRASTPLKVFLDLQELIKKQINNKTRRCFEIICITQQN